MQSRSATRLASKPAGSATLSGGMGGEKDPEADYAQHQLFHCPSLP